MFVLPSRPLSPTASPAEKLVCIMDGLCATIAAFGAVGPMTTPLLFLIWRRLRRIGVRATQVAARLAAGAPAFVARPRPAAPRPPPPTPPTPRPPVLRLPGHQAWLVRVVPGTAAFGTQLQYLLADPEMAPLLAAPSLRRALNPICRMLGIPPPPKPPQPAAAPEPAASDPLAPENTLSSLLQGGEGRVRRVDPESQRVEIPTSPTLGLLRSPSPPRRAGGEGQDAPVPPPLAPNAA